MNVNLLTNVVLTETPAEPARSVSAQQTSGADGSNGNSHIEGASTDKRRGRPQVASTTQREDTQKSYNVASDTRIEGKKPSNDRFENVFQRQLKSDKPSDEGEKKTVKKLQDSTPDNKAQQFHSVAALSVSQPAVIIPVENKQSGADKPTAKQTNQSASKTQTPDNQNVQNPPQVDAKKGLVDKMDIQGKGGKLQQTQPTSSETQNTTNTSQPAKMPNDQTLAAKQVQNQSADMAQITQDTGIGQSKKNNIHPRMENNAVKMNNSANHSLTDSGKLSVSGNQTNIEKAEHSVNLNSQLASILSKNQLPALSIEASLAGNNTNRPSNSSTAGGQKTSTETSNRDRVKDTATGNKKENSHKIESAAQTGPFTGKLNAEKIELSLDKAGSQKSDSGSETAQAVRGQIMTSGPGDAASVNRSMPFDRAASAAANSQSDTVADIREQVSLAVQGSLKQGQQQITIHLNPPELGRVSITFTENNKELTGLLETTNSQTRAEIRQALPDIIRSLEESGINVKRLDVTLSDSSAKSDLMRQSAQQSFRDSPSQDLWQQFGNNNFHDTGGNQLSYNSFVTPANLSSSSESYSQSSPSPHQSSSSTNLLDVLI